MEGSPSNLVSQRFCWNNRDFLDDALVGVEIQSQASVVFLNNDLRGLLYGLGSDATLKLHRNHELLNCFHLSQVTLTHHFSRILVNRPVD